MKIIELIQDYTGIEFSVLATFFAFIALFAWVWIRIFKWIRA